MISIADLKTLLGITSSTDDALLAMLEETAVDMVETKIDNKIDPYTVTSEKIEFESSEFDLQGGGGLDLAQIPLEVRLQYYPVISGVNLVLGNGETLVNNTDYELDPDTGIINLLNGKAGTIFEGLSASYIAGYNTPPSALKYVVVELVKTMYGNASAVKGQGVISSKSLGDLSVTYKKDTDILKQYDSILAKYTRFEP